MGWKAVRKWHTTDQEEPTSLRQNNKVVNIEIITDNMETKQKNGSSSKASKHSAAAAVV